MKILDLVLKKEWFDMIKNGNKREEYREIKPYWTKRLIDKDGNFKSFTHVKFRNGYTNNFVVFRIKDIHIGKGKEEWGGEPNTDVYVIEIVDNSLKNEIQNSLNDIITNNLSKFYINNSISVDNLVNLFTEKIKELFSDNEMHFVCNNDLNNLLINGEDKHTKELFKLLG